MNKQEMIQNMMKSKSSNCLQRSVAQNSKRLSCVLFCMITATSLSVAVGEETYQLKVVTDRADAIYETDQQARFLVTVTNGAKPVIEGTVSYVVDDFMTSYSPKNNYPKGKLNLNDNKGVAVTLSKPGFLRCTITYQTPDNKKIQAIAGAGFSPLEIPPSLPAPDDFDEFWTKQKAELAKIPLNAKLTPVKNSDKTIECFDVQIDCLGGAPVSGYFAKPKNARPKSLPAVLWVHGAGVGSSSLGKAVSGAKKQMLSMDINAHGIANGQSKEFYLELKAGKLKGYPHSGRDHRETTYFRGMFLRLVRAIDFLTSQPEWDGTIVAVLGSSQGGGQALVAGGLDDRVTFVAAGVPAICDHSGRAAGRINGWPKLVATESDGKPNAKTLKAARYVDAVNFASRCRAEAIISVGFIDRTCPPSSCYAAYNQLPGDKKVINEPLMGHEAPRHITAAFLKQLEEHIRKKKTE